MSCWSASPPHWRSTAGPRAPGSARGEAEGRWKDSITTNIRSAEVARAREEVFDEVHALDYLVYAYLQTGQQATARGVLDGIGRFNAWQAPVPIGYFALAAMPARWVLERGAWDEAAVLDTRR